MPSVWQGLWRVEGALPARWRRLAETVRTGWGPTSCKECKSCHLMSLTWVPGRLCCVAKARIAILGFITPLSRNRAIKSLYHFFKQWHLGLAQTSPEPVYCYLPKSLQFPTMVKLGPFPTVPHLAEASRFMSLCILNSSKWQKLMIHQTLVFCVSQFLMQNRNFPKPLSHLLETTESSTLRCEQIMSVAGIYY